MFISYAHEPDNEAHREQVLGLANRLRRDGVDARIDLYEPSPAEGWPKWYEQELLAAAFVLVVCTARYKERFDGNGTTDGGSGLRWEGLILRQLLCDRYPVEVVPVLLPGATVADVPVAIAMYTRRKLPKDYHDLYRQLTGQRAVQMPPLGELRLFVDNLGSRPPVFERREQEARFRGNVRWQPY